MCTCVRINSVVSAVPLVVGKDLLVQVRRQELVQRLPHNAFGGDALLTAVCVRHLEAVPWRLSFAFVWRHEVDALGQLGAGDRVVRHAFPSPALANPLRHWVCWGCVVVVGATCNATAQESQMCVCVCGALGEPTDFGRGGDAPSVCVCEERASDIRPLSGRRAI